MRPSPPHAPEAGHLRPAAARLSQPLPCRGDGDFRSLVEAVQRRGVRVIVVSTISTQPPMIADELRRQADQFVELADIAPEFTRKPGEGRTTRQIRDEE